MHNDFSLVKDIFSKDKIQDLPSRLFYHRKDGSPELLQSQGPSHPALGHGPPPGWLPPPGWVLALQ